MLIVQSKKISKEHKLSFTCSDYALPTLVKILETCHILGSVGASREVHFDFDGDGSAKLDNITINSESSKKWIKKHLPDFKVQYDHDDISI